MREQEHTGSIASLAAHQLADGTILLVSSASDGHLCIWQSGPNSDTDSSGRCGWKLRQIISFGIQLQLCADLTHMPGLSDW